MVGRSLCTRADRQIPSARHRPARVPETGVVDWRGNAWLTRPRTPGSPIYRHDIRDAGIPVRVRCFPIVTGCRMRYRSALAAIPFAGNRGVRCDGYVRSFRSRSPRHRVCPRVRASAYGRQAPAQEV